MPNLTLWSTDADSNAGADPPIHWPEGMAPAAVNNSARAMMAGIACLLRDTTGTMSASGTNAYALSLNQTIANLTRNFEVAFFVSATNTGTATLNVNGTGDKYLTRRFNQLVGPGDLTANVLYRATWVASRDCYIITSPDITSAGTVRLQAGADVDPGWLTCDGRALPVADYIALWGRLGVTYGDAGPGTFRLPDLRGRTAFGADAGTNRLTGVGGLGGLMGNSGGSETVTLSSAQMPAHSHTGTAQEGGGTSGGTTGPAGDHNHGGQVGAAGGHSHGVTINEGGAHSHSGTANTAGGEARGFSFTSGGLTPGGAATYVADINTAEIFENERVTSPDPGHTHNVTIPSGGAHAHTGSISAVGDHQHSVPSSGTHVHALPAAAAHSHPLAIDNAGGGAGHPNIPPGLVLQFVIKT